MLIVEQGAADMKTVHRCWLGVMGVMVLARVAGAAVVAPVVITDPRVEGVRAPLGIEEAAPRFSWRYEAAPDAPRGFRQTHYRLQVASAPENLAIGEADVWDSGKQASPETLSVLYAGKPLTSATRYFWQVTGFDAAGTAYKTETQFFEMGLMKAEDWMGAQWIGATKERPKTIPANLRNLKDYTLDTRFRILEGSMTLQFRTMYISGGGYGIEIQPGTPGKLVVTCRIEQPDKTGKKKTETLILKDYPVPNINKGEWHSLQVTAKGGDFWFRVDDAPLNQEPLHDVTSMQGTVAIGAFTPGKRKGLVQFDDFKLTANGETLVQESFSHPALHAFQDCYFGAVGGTTAKDPETRSYSVVKEGVLEVSAMNTFLDPKAGLAAPLFRKAFTTEAKKIARARAYVAGLGYYTFWVNGKRVDDYLLQPGFARYDKTAYYTVYDLTGQLARENVLGFELGRGWYGMTTPTLWGETFTRDWMAEPALRALVTIDYTDGTRQVVASDPSFKTAPGPVLFDSVKAGEVYDARKEQPGWNGTPFDDRPWSPALIASGRMPMAAPGLTAQLFEPIRVIESFSPVSIEKIEGETDAWLVDFGQNMAGTAAFQFKAQPGTMFRMSYLERMEKVPGHSARERWNNFAAQNTGNFQTDIYVAKGGGEETYQSRYSYKGFRWLRVEGFKEKPAPGQIVAKLFNSDMVRVGKFESSSELWNKIWEAGRRCIQSNMHSIPTDCPTWEKLGWTCDDASPYYAMAYNFDLRKLYEKRLQDYADDISPDGLIRNTIPSAWAKGNDPAWVGSYVNIAWKHYQTYGDRRVIGRHYDNLKLYMSTLIKEGQASDKPPLLTKPKHALGDWVSPDGNCPPEGALIYYNLEFCRYARMMADMATVLGRGDDERYYSTLAADLKQRFNEFHYDEKDGCYYSTNRKAGYRQSPQAMALAFGLVPKDKIPVVANNLAEDIRNKRDGHFWVGILGMEAIADALSENGRVEAAYAAHLKNDYPSLGNMIREGATTLWEDYGAKARSLNHKMFATPLGWMARYVAGLRVEGVLGGGAGFRSAVIAPYPDPAQIKFARFDYDSAMGTYHSGWRVTPEGMAYDIVVPPNASALVRLPLLGKTSVTVSESGKTLWQNGESGDFLAGVSVPVVENDRLVFTLGSGNYSFKVETSAGSTPVTPIPQVKAPATEVQREFAELERQISQCVSWDLNRLEKEAFRRDSLILPEDRNPLDVVLRRSGALLVHLKKANPGLDFTSDQAALDALKAKAVADSNGDRQQALFEEAVVLRRKIAFRNPLLDFDKIVFLKHHKPKKGVAHMVDQYLGFNQKKGGGVFVLENPFGNAPTTRSLLADHPVEKGRLKGSILEGNGSFIALDLDYDGRSIAFAFTEAESGAPPEGASFENQPWTRTNSNYYWSNGRTFHIFRANSDGTGLVQLTDGMWNEYDPCFLPGGRIAFISEKNSGQTRCSDRALPCANLNSMRGDGSDPIRLSWHDTNEWHPSVDNNGMLVYTRWDYVDRDSDVAHHLWSCFPDGRDPRSAHGNYPETREMRPWMEMSIRAIPGSHRFVAVAAPHHGNAYGSMVLIDQRKADDRAFSQLSRLTPTAKFPESEALPGVLRDPKKGWDAKHVGEVYGTPWPLSEDFFLCVYDEAYENFGIYLVDSFGNHELLYRDPSIACLDPIPLRARTRPSVIPPATKQAAEDRDGSKPMPTTGEVMVSNVYESEQPWPEGTKITALRIVNLFPKDTYKFDGPQIGVARQSLARGVLGTVPVERDGSAYFTIPAGAAVYFQALDENGLAVQTMRSDTYVHPGERLSCVGCHESKHYIRSEATGAPLAFKRPPSVITPEMAGSYPLSFPRLVQPVLDAKCLKCHEREKRKAPSLRGDRYSRFGFSNAYESLTKGHATDKSMAWAMCGGNGIMNYHNELQYSVPGQIGARVSGLYNLLKAGHHNVSLSAKELRCITLWLDCNSNFLGSYSEPQRQANGKIVRPKLGIPEWTRFETLKR